MELEQISHTLESLPLNEALETVLSGADPHKVCLTCSFQAEDMIVLHLLRQQIPNVPVLFLDTGYHFGQTYE
jgi:phosphoadenosine phosphosulfate reductase